MLLVKTANGQVEQFPYTLGDLRRDNPQTSFPKDIPDTVLSDYGVYPFTRPDRPDFDPNIEEVQEGSFEQDSNGVWSKPYIVTPLPVSEAQTRVRNARDRLLKQTDWWAVQDRTMSQAEKDYRQALRDIPQQTGFPTNVAWPTKPE